MNRVEGIFSGFFPIIMGVLVLAAVLAFAMRRMKSGGGGSLDEFGNEEAGGSAAGHEKSGIYPSFQAMLDSVILPLSVKHPDWERADGAHGVPGRPLARFQWNGTVYALIGSSEIPALLRAREHLARHPGEEALMVKPSKRASGQLTLRPEVGWPNAEAVRIETV